jgi:DNA-binding response OmpR family regulator
VPLHSCETAPNHAWPVLLCCADPTRVREVTQALEIWPVPVDLTVVGSAMPALRHSLVMPLRLVIVDWALGGPSGQAVVRHLARMRPVLPVLAFNERSVMGPSDQAMTWPWDDLVTVLDHWLMRVDDSGLRQGPTS